MTVAILGTHQTWICPNGCGQTFDTPTPVPNRFHTCPKLRFLSAPLVLEGTKARVFLREREDYVGRELVQLDPEKRRPVMSIITERADGSNDTIVLPPSARMTLDEIERADVRERVAQMLRGIIPANKAPAWLRRRL